VIKWCILFFFAATVSCTHQPDTEISKWERTFWRYRKNIDPGNGHIKRFLVNDSIPYFVFEYHYLLRGDTIELTMHYDENTIYDSITGIVNQGLPEAYHYLKTQEGIFKGRSVLLFDWESEEQTVNHQYMNFENHIIVVDKRIINRRIVYDKSAKDSVLRVHLNTQTIYFNTDDHSSFETHSSYSQYYLKNFGIYYMNALNTETNDFYEIKFDTLFKNRKKPEKFL